VTADKKLAKEFDEAMHSIYRRALAEAGYKASIFLNMLFEHDGVETARRLIHSSKVSDGYTALWERGRLDLTVEALIADNGKWQPLFSAEEIAICRKRLKQFEYVRETYAKGRTGHSKRAS
jgi:hypothetical protein